MTRSQVDIVLVVPPFASAVMPMLGPSLLKSKLIDAGLSATIIYANLVAAKALGTRLYQDIADSDVRMLWGEILSSQTDASWDRGIGKQVLTPMPDHLRGTTAGLKESFNESARAIAGLHPRIVGFSSSFQQNVAAITLARHLRRLCPSAVCVIGGANMDAPMGAAFHARFAAEFDYVFSGEADVSFCSFCQDMLGPRVTQWPCVIKSEPALAFEFAGTPDFDDYFLQGGGPIQTELIGECVLPFEISRGCWWGQKHHCTFCGLNANGMNHRAKPATVVETEVRAIVDRHSPNLLFATDNIMPLEMFRRASTLHPRAGTDIRVFFETKSNLRDEDLDCLVEMGIWEIQPGIESFSTAILKGLRKGNTGPAHLCLLREAASRQIHITWNLLVDVPGEQEEDYMSMLALLPAIRHLQPPTGCAAIRIDRYSPYFTHQEQFGLKNVRPIAPFSLLYGPEPESGDMCYFFEADYHSASRQKPELAAALVEAVGDWRKSWLEPDRHRSLVGLRNRAGQYLILDQTAGDLPRLTTIPTEHEQLLFRTKRPTPAGLLSSEEAAILAAYEDRGIVTKFEDQYIYLATEPWRGLELRAACMARPPSFV